MLWYYIADNIVTGSIYSLYVYPQINAYHSSEKHSLTPNSPSSCALALFPSCFPPHTLLNLSTLQELTLLLHVKYFYKARASIDFN